MKEKMLMNSATGAVDTEENWRSDLDCSAPELLNGLSVDDAMATLVEVVSDGDGRWIEVE